MKNKNCIIISLEIQSEFESDTEFVKPQSESEEEPPKKRKKQPTDENA